MLRRVCLPLMVLLGLGSGCATSQLPSPVEARQATPGSITRDKPGGDAANPIDAALERLLSEPLGKKVDRWGTLGVHLPDPNNWKRVRFWGYPTRVGFRYGKDPAIAVGMVSYTDAEGDDSTDACMKALVERAHAAAGLFDVEVGEIQREVRTHRSGAESVDWEQASAAWEVEKQHRMEENRKRLIELRAKKKERIEAARKRYRARREAAAKKRAEQAAARAIPPSPGVPTAPTNERPQDDANPKRATHANDVHAKNDAKNAEPDNANANDAKDTESDAAPSGRRDARAHGATHADAKAARRPRRPLFRLRPLPEAGPPSPRTGTGPVSVVAKAEDLEARKRRMAATGPLAERRRLQAAQPYRRVPIPKDLPDGHMTVLRSSGHLNTLFKRDDYEVGVVAYESWPGTCLVQGFAVKVGTDVALAQQVVARWIEQAAPSLYWANWLREAPPFANR